ALLYICEKEGLDLPKANNLINKKSGVQGISGVSSDFRELQAAMEKGNEKAALALDVFCYNVKKYIGAYAAVLNGVDLIIFTGGIGENDNLVRWETCKNMDYLGIQVDKQKNEVRGKDTIISTEQSTTTVMTVTTDEELVIAMDTVRLS
ncbi:acetate kinase, partial [Odoribacter splanchnicus]|nr:acetate kinase [Odoribacter splanchnicus]